MLDTPNTSDTHDDRQHLRRMLERYAGRYYLTGPDRSALVSQTITAFADNPEVLLDQPVEKAIASTMHDIFCRNMGIR